MVEVLVEHVMKKVPESKKKLIPRIALKINKRKMTENHRLEKIWKVQNAEIRRKK